MIDSDRDRNPIEVLAEEFARRCRQGERPSASEYAERYPEYADEIRELLPSVGMIEQLRRKESAERDLLERRSKFQGKPFERLGEYEILREVGRGGMGVVFEARQKSLGRRVALKVLTAGVLSSPKQLVRFEREATAAARLHHTNIVPVFGVGEQDEVHFYVMQFIDGVALDAVLQELRRLDSGTSNLQHETASELAETECDRPATLSAPMAAQALSSGDYFKAVARIGLQVAGALEYAHGQGVLHRDVKPANLLLDTRGAAWVTDFGLAKLAEHEGLTNSGDVVGTLRYMAPEQFDGQGDERSDVYSLGLTLYEMLTLQPAGEESPRADSIRRLTRRSFPQLRMIGASIPRDLETIILKATVADPDRRYRSAGGLAEDLQRFLEDRPILARRTSTAERLWRWGRRNPLSALLTVTTLVLLVLIAIVASVSNVRTRLALARADEERQNVERAMKQVEDQRNRARAEHARAEANLDLAMVAFKDIIESVASRGIPQSSQEDLDEEDPPKFEAEVTADDAELLQSLLKFFDEFASRNGTDLQVERAQAYRRVGDIRLRLGQFTLAELAYREALAIHRALSDKRPGEAGPVIAQAEILNDLGNVQSKSGRTSQALESYQATQEFLERQPQEILSRREARFELAQTLNLVASLGPRAGMHFGRPDSHRHGPDHPPPAWHREPGAAGEASRPPRDATVQRHGFHNATRLQENFVQALGLLRSLVEEEPDNAEYQLALAHCYRNHLPMACANGPEEDAGKSLEEAILILERLIASRPNDPKFRFELADTLAMSLWLPASIAPEEESRARLDRAVALAQELVKAFPGIAEYRALLASSRAKLAGLERRWNDLDAADENYREAAALQSALVEQFSAMPVYRSSLVRSLHDWGKLQRDRGELVESRKTFERGIEILKTSLKGGPEDPFYARPLAGLYHDLSMTLRLSWEDVLADQADQQAKELDRGRPHGPSFFRQPSDRPPEVCGKNSDEELQ